MPRKRMLHPNIWEDPTFNRLSKEARLLFIGMISNSDDEGFIRADRGSLKRLIFGFDDDTSGLDSWIEEIKKIKNIHFYEHNGEKYAHFLKWQEYQKQKKDRVLASCYPNCSICLAGGGQVADECQAVVSQSKVKGSKVKGSKSTANEPDINFKIKIMSDILEYVPCDDGGFTGDEQRAYQKQKKQSAIQQAKENGWSALDLWEYQKTSRMRNVKIITMFMQHKQYEENGLFEEDGLFGSIEKYNQEFRRHLTPASRLKGFTDKEILNTFEYLDTLEYLDRWTLETVMKYMEEARRKNVPVETIVI